MLILTLTYVEQKHFKMAVLNKTMVEVQLFWGIHTTC